MIATFHGTPYNITSVALPSQWWHFLSQRCPPVRQQKRSHKTRTSDPGSSSVMQTVISSKSFPSLVAGAARPGSAAALPWRTSRSSTQFDRRLPTFVSPPLANVFSYLRIGSLENSSSLKSKSKFFFYEKNVERKPVPTTNWYSINCHK